MNLNRWQGIGNLGKDPEIRYTQKGDAIANFVVAVSKKWTNKATGERNEHTEWVRCTAFRQTAQFAEQYMGKGDRVYVEGELNTRKWQDQQGQDRFVTEVTNCHVQLLSSGPKKSEAESKTEDFDSDIPF